MTDNLKECQTAGEELERKMIEFLIGYLPIRELRICDLLYISSIARNLAFDAFYKDQSK